MAESATSSSQADLVDAIREIFKSSDEPLTHRKLRLRLPEPFDGLRTEELAEVLERQVAAHVFVRCPKYRSGQDRYWDRNLREHAKVVMHAALEKGPMSWPELRKKLPKYLRHLAESVLNEELAKGEVHRHPPSASNGGFRFGMQPADVRAYAAKELEGTLARMVQLGFSLCDSRESLMQLLHESEWAEEAPYQPGLPVGALIETAETWQQTIS